MGIAKRGLEDEPSLSHIIQVFEAAKNRLNHGKRKEDRISTAEVVNLMEIEASSKRTEAEREKAAAIDRLACAVEKIGVNSSMEIMASVISLMRDNDGDSVRALDAKLKARHGLTSTANGSVNNIGEGDNNGCTAYVGRHFKPVTPEPEQLESDVLTFSDDDETGLFPPLLTKP